MEFNNLIRSVLAHDGDDGLCLPIWRETGRDVCSLRRLGQECSHACEIEASVGLTEAELVSSESAQLNWPR